MVKIRKCLNGITKLSYAEQVNESAYEVIYDCSLGINPFGYSKNVEAALKNNTFDINSYPNHPHSSARKAIANFWGGMANLTEDNIRLVGGSIAALYIICQIFIEEGSKALGYTPQFVDFTSAIKSMGGTYSSVDMRENKNCKFDVNKLVDAIDDSYSIVYVDNPNNPTGQIISLDDIELLAKKAAEFSIPLLVDEAYGDFMRSDQSAMALLDKYKNLIVARSFSKGYGLAGLRTGYVACDKRIVELCDLVSYPFTITNQAACLVEAAIGDREFLDDCRNKIAVSKGQLLSGLTKLQYYETDMHVPIMTLIDPNGGDLYNALRERGVLTEAGTDLGLGKSAVRLRINRQPAELLEILNNLPL